MEVMKILWQKLILIRKRINIRYWPRITRMHEYDIDARIHRMAVQKRTGEWYEEQIIRIKNGFKLYYYDEGCVDWVDEWREVS